MSPSFAEKVWQVLVGLVQYAEENMPNVDGKTKKQQVIDWACTTVNWAEGLLPVFKWANLPAVDALERFAIGLAVEWAWTQMQLPKEQRVSAVRNVGPLAPAFAA